MVYFWSETLVYFWAEINRLACKLLFYFLQKKTSAERDAAVNGEDYEVFMAIGENVGKDRRGVPIYLRDDDGAELLFDDIKEILFRDNNGNTKLSSRKVRVKRLDDDLPNIRKAYIEFLKLVKL
ncbi:MAG: hypothetical protein GZ094_04955 [Mariniphaga sp.]|nr:hypothetical protein [Mariniphaga sp.]